METETEDQTERVEAIDRLKVKDFPTQITFTYWSDGDLEIHFPDFRATQYLRSEDAHKLIDFLHMYYS